MIPESRVEPHLFVIMGATGDLTRRKLLPALFHLREQGHFDGDCLILGVDLKDRPEADFRAWAREALYEAGIRTPTKTWCDESVHYRAIEPGSMKDYEALAGDIQVLEHRHRLPGNRVFYLALPPTVLSGTIEALGETGLNRCPGWCRVVVEKPFGHDFASAQALNQRIHRYFDESEVYRIDHYLGKETVQNLFAFRFANPMFESLWNRDRVECVEITVAEDLGVGHRGGYYERIGALRDMVQNHLTQLMTLIAMEVPVVFDAEAIRSEKLKILQATMPVVPENVVFGQYTSWAFRNEKFAGYREEPGVPVDSHTETFVALKLELHTWRWQGVPFYLRTGKRLPRKITQIAVIFRKAPISIFRSFGAPRPHSNVLLMTLQPNEGFALCFDVKMPGKPFRLDTRSLQFDYQTAFGPLQDAYETLLLDILTGDQTLFVRGDLAEASWQLYDPLQKADIPIHPYPSFSWGPPAADDLLARNGHSWHVDW